MKMGVLALERIEHQQDDFGQKLEGLIAQVMQDMASQNLYGKNLDGYPVIRHMETLISKRLGLKVELHTNSHTAAILPFYSNRNHIFLADMVRGEIDIRAQTRLLNTLDKRQGEVNLTTATVSGLFSEYTHPLYLNISRLVQHHEMTPPEITSVLLHELGHGFAACYYSDRTDQTNQVLAAVFRKFTDHNSKDSVEYIYRELSKLSDTTQKADVDQMVNGPRVVAGLVWFKTVIKVIRSQMSHDKYNETAFEELADAFASRFGYAKHLALALDKIHQGSPMKSQGMLAMCRMLDFVSLAAMATFTLSLLAGGGYAMALFLALWNLWALMSNTEDNLDYTYDELKDRYIRIRSDTVTFLKDPSLPKDTVRVTLENIYSLDAVIKETHRYKSIYTHVGNFLFSDGRAAVNAIDAQKTMEKLASNDLFINAAEFKTLK
jgi:hypothetical protein